MSIRVALDEVPVLTSVAHRVGWAALVLWVVILFRRLEVPKAPQVWLAFLIMGILNNVIPFSLMAWGQLFIETGLTSILNAATAIFGVLMAALFLSDERLSVRRFVGVALGFLGVSTAIGLEALLAFDPRSLAQLAVLAGTLSYAVAGVWARRRLSGVHPVVAAGGMLSASALIMVPVAWAVDGPISFALQPQTIMAIGYYAMIATAFAYMLYYRVLAMAGAGNVMLCTLLVAPVAIILGAIFLGETLAPRAYAGFGLLALGLLLIDGRILRRRSISPTP